MQTPTPSKPLGNPLDAALADASGKASALIEALSYIQRFHNKVVVVKVGGSIMDDEAGLTNLLTDVVFMNYVGMQPILVHGGGKAINDAMHKAGLEPQMVQGRRYTDERTLAIAEHVLCNQINRFIVNFIQASGCEAMGLNSLTSNVLTAEKTFLPGPDGRRIDLGFVGEVKHVNARLLQLMVQADSIPCIATIARDPAGQRLNVNADTAAGAVAAATKADKLVVISDTHGIRSDPNDPASLVPHLTVAQIGRDGEERRDRQRHVAQGRGVRRRPPRRRRQDAHHRRPHPARAAAGNLHRGGDRDRDRFVVSVD